MKRKSKDSPLNILGLNLRSQNTGASLIRNGELIASVEEERLDRHKFSSAFPMRSIHYVLGEGGLSLQDIDAVGIGWKASAKLGRRLAYGLAVPGSMPSFFFNQAINHYAWLKNKKDVRRRLELSQHCQVIPIEHHLAHAASCFHVSPFDEAAIMTLDGHGEWSTTMLAHGKGTQIHRLREVCWPHSLGKLYHIFSEHLGFPDHGDEYKVMGLAPYGKPHYVDKVRKLLNYNGSGTFKIDLSYFNYDRYGITDPPTQFTPRFKALFGEPRQEHEEITQYHRDLAVSLQMVLNETVLAIVKSLHRMVPTDNLCMAGGVALNCVTNQFIRENGPFKNVFIQPASNDGGISLGSACYLYHHAFERPRTFTMTHSYFGPGYTNAEIKKELDICQLAYEHVDNIPQRVAALLNAGKVIGWFQGRMEIGPRALGNRSIIAPAGPADMKDIVNARIKFREEFRPFAPSVLQERAQEFFSMEGSAPFMLFTTQVKPDKAHLIPAVTHVDGSARVQTVTRENNGLYWELIKEYEKLSGIPVILNTSFNVKGEPIVCTPADAIRCFYSTGLDYLVLGNYLLAKTTRA